MTAKNSHRGIAMKNKNIGFIGTGNMGAALVRAVRAAGYPALLYDRDGAKASALAADTDKSMGVGMSRG